MSRERSGFGAGFFIGMAATVGLAYLLLKWADKNQDSPPAREETRSPSRK